MRCGNSPILYRGTCPGTGSGVAHEATLPRGSDSSWRLPVIITVRAIDTDAADALVAAKYRCRPNTANACGLKSRWRGPSVGHVTAPRELGVAIGTCRFVPRGTA